MKTCIQMRAARVLTAAVALATVALGATHASAATESNFGSGVQAYFASQSNAYTDSNLNVGSFPVAPTPTPGIGYPVGAVITNLPAQPTPIVFYPGSFTGNPFSGTASVSSFADTAVPPSTITTSVSKIVDSYTTSPSLTQDTSIQITNWNFNQPSGATGYAYAQLNFASSYVITSTGLGGSTPNFPLFITGNVNSTSANPGFFQYDEVVNYTWIPCTLGVNTAGLPTPVPSSATVSLGALTYSYYQSTGGTVAASLTSVGSLAATPSGYGVLELTGHAWIAGDPFQVTITPEPTSLAVLALGGLALVSRRRRSA